VQQTGDDPETINAIENSAIVQTKKRKNLSNILGNSVNTRPSTTGAEHRRGLEEQKENNWHALARPCALAG